MGGVGGEGVRVGACDLVSLCNGPGCLRNHFEDQTGLALTEIYPASASQVLGLKHQAQLEVNYNTSLKLKGRVMQNFNIQGLRKEEKLNRVHTTKKKANIFP